MSTTPQPTMASSDQSQPEQNSTIKERVVGFAAVFTSTGTLLCCALPAAIATVAGGAAVASLVSTFPWLIPISANKGWIFLTSGLMISLTALLLFRPNGKVACSISGSKGCHVSGRFTKVMFWTSAGIYSIGAFFAYAIVPILRFIEN